MDWKMNPARGHHQLKAHGLVFDVETDGPLACSLWVGGKGRPRRCIGRFSAARDAKIVAEEVVLALASLRERDKEVGHAS